MTRPRILMLTKMHPSGMERLAEEADVRFASSLDPETLRREVTDVDGLILRTSGCIDAGLLDAAPRLRVVGRHGVGFDHVDVEAATARGVMVVYTPGANTESVCEHAFALMIGLSKHFPRMMAAVADYRHDDRTSLQGRDLLGRTLGIVGFGRIGRRVGQVAHAAFSMKVTYSDIVQPPRESEIAAGGARRVGFDELLGACEYVTLHVPLDKSTRGMIGRRELALMRPDAILINTCRGAVVDEAAVAEALDAGRLWGFGSDVYAEEPPVPGHPLIGRNDVMLTPHSAAQTEESLINMATWVAEDVLRVLRGERPRNPVNDPAVVELRRAERSTGLSST